MRILYIGFKGKNNMSFRLVSYLSGERIFLTNSFAGIAREIDALSINCDAVAIFGVDKMLSTSVRIERCANKEDIFLHTAHSVCQLVKVLNSNGVNCEISDKSTAYLCNEAYYRLLQKTTGKAILIHIPSIRHMTAELMAGLLNSFAEYGGYSQG